MNKQEPFILREGDPVLHLEEISRCFPWVTAGFSTRQQGVSKHPYASLNVGLHVGDKPESVHQNRKKVILSQGFLEEQWVSANQVHGANLYQVSVSDKGKGFFSLSSAIPDTDALYTTEPNLFLASFYADCVPLYFIDLKQKIVGIAHAGWKGTAAQIGPKLIKCWAEQFHSKLADIRVFIGPAIGACCYEVDQYVLSFFQKFQGELSSSGIIKKEDNKYMLNLQQINYDLMIKAGIMAEHIEVSQWCTSCHADLFFSHRRDKGKTGRMVAFIGIKEET